MMQTRKTFLKQWLWPWKPQNPFQKPLRGGFSQKSFQFFRLRHKMSRLLSIHTFLFRCRDHNVIPNFLKIKDQFSTSSSRKILSESSWSLVPERKRAARRELNFVAQDLHSLDLKHANTVSLSDWALFDRITSITNPKPLSNYPAINTFENFNHYFHINSRHPHTHDSQNSKMVVNFWSHQLSELETNLCPKVLTSQLPPIKFLPIKSSMLLNLLFDPVLNNPRTPAASKCQNSKIQSTQRWETCSSRLQIQFWLSGLVICTIYVQL